MTDSEVINYLEEVVKTLNTAQANLASPNFQACPVQGVSCHGCPVKKVCRILLKADTLLEHSICKVLSVIDSMERR